MTDQTESEYFELLADLTGLSAEVRIADDTDIALDAIEAIRALEAKVKALEHARDTLYVAKPFVNTLEKMLADADETERELRADRNRLAEALAVEKRIAKGWQETAEKFRGERDRLDLEAARLAGEVERLRNHTNMWNGCTCWSYTSQEKAHADNCVLSVHAAEVARITSELAAAREELAQRREHMRRGIEPGRPTGGVG